MTSTMNRKEVNGGKAVVGSSYTNSAHQLPGYTNGGTHIPLGSEGSSRGSELSSGEGQLPETVDIDVILPDKTTKSFTVDYGKQMMDFLVQATTSCRLSPTTHTFVVYSEETGRPMDYYASQPVGSTGACTFHVVEKKSELQRKREIENSAVQTFEITHRLTINLPKNQKMITRVSPKSTLADIFKMVCSEKNLDPYKYDLRHPTQPDLALNMASPLRDYQLVEITVVAVGPESRHNISNLSDFDLCDLNSTSASSSSHRSVRSASNIASGSLSSSASSSAVNSYSSSSTMEKKKKRGLLSIFSKKKEGKFKVSEATYNESTSTLPSNSTPMTGVNNNSSNSHTSIKRNNSSQIHSQNNHNKVANTNNKNNKHISVDSSFIDSQDRSMGGRVGDESNNNVDKLQGQQIPPKPPRKKRHAPPPPPSSSKTTNTDTTTITTTITTTTSSQSASTKPQHTSTHSRNSSHSSGFESAGSPIESPGTSRGSSDQNTVQSAKTLSSATQIKGEEEVVLPATGDSLRASRAQQQPKQQQLDVRPKTTTTTSSSSITTAKKKKVPTATLR